MVFQHRASEFERGREKVSEFEPAGGLVSVRV